MISEESISSRTLVDSTVTSSADEHAEKEKTPRQRGHKKPKSKLPSKIVVRHLPPTMTEEEFLEQIDPLPDHDYYYFVDADWSLGNEATCRAYITLKEHDDVFLFHERFDGYVFVDSRGQEYSAIVEYAPFQGMAKNKSRRHDNKVNTIESEPHFQEFLVALEEAYENEARGGENKLNFSFDNSKEDEISSTPLLQYLADKKEKRREEAKKRNEEKRRQRDEDKDKRKTPTVTKILSPPEDANKSNKSDERKNSRSKRRAERDQRRREEHEKRKKEREQKGKENTGKKQQSLEDIKEKSTSDMNLPQEKEQQSGKVSQQRSETKKHSDRRERERERNRLRREKRNEIKTSNASSTEAQSAVVLPKLISVKSIGEFTSNDDEVNENVLSFIQSVSATIPAKVDDNVKEIKILKKSPANTAALISNADESNPIEAVPVVETVEELSVSKTVTAMEEQKPENQAEQPTAAAESIASKLEVKADILKEITSTTNDAETEKQIEQPSAAEVITPKDAPAVETSNEAATNSRETQRQRSSEERRIRNKDRPTIAFYQPKQRLRLPEDSDAGAAVVATSATSATAAKDTRSNPTSDTDSVKKDDSTQKDLGRKITRYSDQRSERRRHAPKSGEGDAGFNKTIERRHKLRKTKSCDDSSERGKKLSTSEDQKQQQQQQDVKREN